MAMTQRNILKRDVLAPGIEVMSGVEDPKNFQDIDQISREIQTLLIPTEELKKRKVSYVD